MPGNTSLHVVDLKPGCKEYQDVLMNFEKTMQSTSPMPGGGQTVLAALSSLSVLQATYTSIIRIQRIQNLALYTQYIAKKSEMDKNNKSGHQNEMQLFHGTAVDTCPKINQQGFNRSFSGKNGKESCA